jgi:hypothetical protein
MQKIQYIGIKEDGKAFRVVNSKLLTEELNRLSKGKYRLTVEKYRKNKSNPQLGYLFACVYPLSQKLLLDAGWELPSIESVDAFWKQKFAESRIVNRHTGEVLEIPGLKREFTTTEMMGYIESIRQYCAEYLGGYIPEPMEQMKIEI